MEKHRPLLGLEGQPLVERQNFSVQPCQVIQGELQIGSCIHVEASCALHAAEKALGTTLALHGSTARAKVWFFKDGYTPESVVLYEPDALTHAAR